MHNGYRLPTEAEWEYAALGGKDGVTATNPTDYAGTDNSSDLGNYAWYTTNSGSKTHEVKKKTANSLNIFDLSGNVWEWCWDWYGSITATGENTTPVTGVASGSGRVCRGGCYSFCADDCSVANRGYGLPGGCGDIVGFRVVCSAQ